MEKSIVKKQENTFLREAKKFAEKMHQHNIQMIESSNMTKKEKALALKRIKAAYCR